MAADRSAPAGTSADAPPAAEVRLTLDPSFAIGPVDRRLFGSFVEHMGRCVYTGIFEPDHPTADDDGFRTDVLDLVRELGVTLVRYPGGNFVSNYRWEDGVGPVADRPRRLDLAWRSIETNAVGTDEFATWCGKAGVEPMLAVNLGTRGVAEACELLEYCNYPEGTALSDRRVANGTKQPHDIRLWCLGNELDGPWQIGHRTAAEYGRIALETANAMRRVDPRVRLVACGSSNDEMPTFGTWERVVLEHCYDQVDHLSVHQYYEQQGDDLDSFLASGVQMDRYIESVLATADHVAAVRRSRKRLSLSFDEWNVWYQSEFPGEENLDWTEGPELIEDTYTVIDAVVVGGLLISLLKHADRVSIACQAQLVNVIAPIRTQPNGPAWRQTIFHPFALAAAHARGTVLRIEPAGPTMDTAAHGEVPVVDATATVDPETGVATVFAVNRGRAPIRLAADIRALADRALAGRALAGREAGSGTYRITHSVVADDDLTAVNTATAPDRVVPRTVAGTAGAADGTVTAVLPAVSFNVLQLTPLDSAGRQAPPAARDEFATDKGEPR